MKMSLEIFQNANKWMMYANDVKESMFVTSF